jgi:aquaporin Z
MTLTYAAALDEARAGTKGPAAAAVVWREAAIEAGALATFIVAAVAITAVIEHPASPVRQLLIDSLVRRTVTGLAMGMMAAAIIYSPWGRRSGAHLNPAVTLSFARLGKVASRDAALYIAGHFVGGVAGIGAAVLVAPSIASQPAVNFVATLPGSAGGGAAFAGELAISFGMMLTVLTVSNRPPLERYTGVCAACLIAVYIVIESPLSGMSMNPARSFGPALAAGSLRSLWIYFLAPPVGMLLAAELYVRRHGKAAVRCAKLHHPHGPCHFNCAHPMKSASLERQL